MTKPLSFPPLFDRVKEILSTSEVYLVGGAIRDAFLGIETRDLDFTLPSESISAARKVADRIGGAFYILDADRGAARVIVSDDRDRRFMLDFTIFQGRRIEDDLRARDFTVTAMAVPMEEPQRLIDPLGGIRDLQQGVLRACTEHAMRDDPLRILRAIRIAVQYDFRISTKTKSQIKDAKSGLQEVSQERLRDEFFHMLEGPHPAAAMKALSLMDLIPFILPGYAPLTRYHQRCLRYLERLWDLLGEEHDPEAAASWAMGLSVLRLGRYREHIRTYGTSTLVPERPLSALVSFAALYVPQQKGDQAYQEARVEGVDHGRALYLSNAECKRLDSMIQAFHMIRTLAEKADPPSTREVYRYFQTYSEAGVDGIFLSLVDVLARYGTGRPQEEWPRILDVARTCLEAWWENRDEVISPPPLVNGHDLLETFDLSPGPEIGQILMELHEEQAVGKISTREEALAYVESILAKHS